MTAMAGESDAIATAHDIPTTPYPNVLYDQMTEIYLSKIWNDYRKAARMATKAGHELHADPMRQRILLPYLVALAAAREHRPNLGPRGLRDDIDHMLQGWSGTIELGYDEAREAAMVELYGEASESWPPVNRRCVRCGLLLTALESMARGYGKECAEKMGGA